MSPFFIKAIQLLLSLSLLIVLHELGHFIPAKLFKTRVEKFYLFFDVKFSLFKKKIGETVYGIGWLPLGGYVKIAGMIDESMDTEHLKQAPQPWEFRSKPAWQRLIIMLGGVTVNLLLGFLIYIMIAFVWGKINLTHEQFPDGFQVSEMMTPYGFRDGDQILEVDGKPLDNILDINKFLFLRSVKNIKVRHADGLTETLTIPEHIGSKMFESGVLTPFTLLKPAKIGVVEAGSPAAVAGFLPQDEIVSVNNQKVIGWSNSRALILQHEGDSVEVSVLRAGNIVSLKTAKKQDGYIGLEVEGSNSFAISPTSVGLIESIGLGLRTGYWTLHDYVAQFKYVFTKKGASQVGGFGAIGSLFPAHWNWLGFWESTALISIILAFMNILPIPALDGGHVMFLTYEMITGRKPHDKFMEYAQLLGFLLLISLVLFANGNDVYRAIFE